MVLKLTALRVSRLTKPESFLNKENDVPTTFKDLRDLDKQLNKQARYVDNSGHDWIDEFSKNATVDEFRGAMKFTIGKYLRRIGKKDDITLELEKIADYSNRWSIYESNLKELENNDKI
jgi:hypothetical protein